MSALDASAFVKINCTLTEASISSRHAFADGKKGSRILPVKQPSSSDIYDILCNEKLEVWDYVKILDVYLESDLNTNMQLQPTAAAM